MFLACVEAIPILAAILILVAILAAGMTTIVTLLVTKQRLEEVLTVPASPTEKASPTALSRIVLLTEVLTEVPTVLRADLLTEVPTVLVRNGLSQAL